MEDADDESGGDDDKDGDNEDDDDADFDDESGGRQWWRWWLCDLNLFCSSQRATAMTALHTTWQHCSALHGVDYTIENTA